MNISPNPKTVIELHKFQTKMKSKYNRMSIPWGELLQMLMLGYRDMEQEITDHKLTITNIQLKLDDEHQFNKNLLLAQANRPIQQYHPQMNQATQINQLAPPPPAPTKRPLTNIKMINTGDLKKDYRNEIKQIFDGHPRKPSEIATFNENIDRKIIEIREDDAIVDVDEFSKLRGKEWYQVKKSEKK